MRKTLNRKYDHKEVEKDYYKDWVEKGYFTGYDMIKILYIPRGKKSYVLSLKVPQLTLQNGNFQFIEQ